jgi:hypothetical protein
MNLAGLVFLSSAVPSNPAEWPLQKHHNLSSSAPFAATRLGRAVHSAANGTACVSSRPNQNGDGNPFPQLIEARMEAFCLQAQRLNEQMLACGSH